MSDRVFLAKGRLVRGVPGVDNQAMDWMHPQRLPHSGEAGPEFGALRLVAGSGAFMLFARRGQSFEVERRFGYDDEEFSYPFLATHPGRMRRAFEVGYARLEDVDASIPGRAVWVAVDRSPVPDYMLVAELPDEVSDAGPALRYALVLYCDRPRRLHAEKPDLPVWLRGPLESLADRRSPLLIVSESGSGKEELVLAFLERRFGSESAGIFFHPGRLSEPVQLRELFGDPAGARLGGPGPGVPIVERPEPVVIIQEAADLAPHAQLRLLAHFSQQDVEKFWIFETSRDLARMAQSERFLPGLHRIIEPNRIVLPPVRARKDDLPAEANRLLENFRLRYHRDVTLDPGALQAMDQYDWPGNWRELKNTIESAFLMSVGGVIMAEDLRLGTWTTPEDWDDLNLRKRSEEMEKSLLLRAYALHGGNQVHMARALGISRGSLQYKLEKYKLN